MGQGSSSRTETKYQTAINIIKINRMKKLLYSLSILMVCGLSAQAEVPVAQRVELQKRSVKTTEITNVSVPQTTGTFQRITPYTPKAPGNLTAEDFTGIYKWTSTNGLKGESWPTEGFFSIVLNPDKENGVLIQDFPTWYTTEADFDPATGRLNIPDHLIETFYDTIPATATDPEIIITEEIWFRNYTGKNDIVQGEKHIVFVQNPDSPYYMRMLSDGNLAGYGEIDMDKFAAYEYTDEELKDLFCAASAVSYVDGIEKGWYLLIYWLEGERLDNYQVDLNEWSPMGEAEFKDAWWPVLWDGGQTPAAYNVPLYRKNDDKNTFLLDNPYGPNTVYTEEGANISSVPGYIIFNIQDPYCVVFRPLVYAISVPMENKENGEGAYCYNVEGQYYYITGLNTTDIMITLDSFGMLTSELNSVTRQITVRNPLIAYVSDPTAGLWWGGSQYQGFTGTIKLPVGYNGIGSIVDDSKNGEPVYYNLQGVRVDNPEKGQLVIVKQGGKAEKMIVR